MITHDLNGPALWSDLLAKVSAKIGTPAVIAGGAVRDFLLGQDAKDIDIFVNVKTLREVEALGAALADSGFDLEVMDHTEYEDAPDWVNAVTGVLDGSYGGHPVQIIARPSARFSGDTLVEAFDFAITQCWFDGEIHDTPAAAADREAKTVTLTRWNSPAHVLVSYLRFERFRKRCPSFRLVDARPEFLTMAKDDFAEAFA